MPIISSRQARCPTIGCRKRLTEACIDPANQIKLAVAHVNRTDAAATLVYGIYGAGIGSVENARAQCLIGDAQLAAEEGLIPPPDPAREPGES